MSSVTYNSVTIEDVLLQAIDMTPVYDEEGGSDPIGIRTTVICKGVLFAGSLSTVTLGHQVGSSLSQSSNTLFRLNQPRKRFTYTLGDGTKLFDISPSAVTPGTGSEVFGSTSSDINNGPRPFCRLDRINGSKAAHITFGVEFVTWDCSTNKDITNLRYYCSEDIDQDWFRTRTFQGRLKIRSRAKAPFSFRGFVIPPLQGGFKRESMSFEESPDGLSLRFKIVDREVNASPPFPSTTWRGDSSTSVHDGHRIIESVNVTLSGPPSVHKKDLLNVAFRILDTKLQLLAGADAEETPYFIDIATFSESLDENSVTATIRIQHTKNPLSRLLFIGRESFGQPLPPSVGLDGNYDPKRHRVPLIPNSLAGLFTSAMQDPCFPAGLANVSIDVAETPDTIDTEGEDQEEADDTALEGLTTPLLDPDEQRSIYTDYKLSSETAQESGKQTFPLASSSNSSKIATIQFHQGFPRRIIRVEAERVGVPPKLPAPISFTDPLNSIYHELIDYTIENGAVKLAPDGVSKIYNVQMTIIYGLSRPLTNSDKIYGATMPYDTLNIESNFLPSSIFVSPSSGGALA